MSQEDSKPDNNPSGGDVAQNSLPLVRILPSETLDSNEPSNPQVELPGDNRLISGFAEDLGQELAGTDIFIRNSEVVRFDRATMKILPVHPQEFRTLAEKSISVFKLAGKERAMVLHSMCNDIAQAVLHSSGFKERLRVLRRVNQCRQPVLRHDGRIELLPEGYDKDTQTLTLGTVSFGEDMEPDRAVGVLKNAFAEFCFVNRSHALAVAIAAMVGVFAQGLLPPRSIRPCIIVLANGPGAGKTLLVQLIAFPTLGTVAIGCLPAREEEAEKLLLAAVREGKLVLVLDNFKGHLDNQKLEGFTTSGIWGGRVLGQSSTYEGENLTSVFLTGNGTTLSPDMSRRSLIIELHIDVERPEDRKFKVNLNDATMTQMRPDLLAALWALIRKWDSLGRPACSRTNSSFTDWSSIIGGIVEAVGLGCCLERPETAAAVDRDGEDMRRLVKGMADEGRANYGFRGIVEIALELGCFERILGMGGMPLGEGDLERMLNRSQSARFGRLLERYAGRQIADHRFIITGVGHTRRFAVELLVARADAQVDAQATAPAPEPAQAPPTPKPEVRGPKVPPPNFFKEVDME